MPADSKLPLPYTMRQSTFTWRFLHEQGLYDLRIDALCGHYELKWWPSQAPGEMLKTGRIQSIAVTYLDPTRTERAALLERGRALFVWAINDFEAFLVHCFL